MADCRRVAKVVWVELAAKLRRLTENANRAETARLAGLKPAVFNNYIYRGSQPLPAASVKLARALNVPLEWLLDDEQDWPPPPRGGAAALSTEELAAELGQRMRGTATMLFENICRAQKIDWIKVASELLKADFSKLNTPAGTPLPKWLMDAADIPGQCNYLLSQLRHYNPHAEVGESAPPEVLKVVLPTFEVTLIDLLTQARHLYELPGFGITAKIGGYFTVPPDLRTSLNPPNIEWNRDRAARELAALQTALQNAPPPVTLADRLKAARQGDGEPGDVAIDAGQVRKLGGKTPASRRGKKR